MHFLSYNDRFGENIDNLLDQDSNISTIRVNYHSQNSLSFIEFLLQIIKLRFIFSV